jgi:hypothetical protein
VDAAEDFRRNLKWILDHREQFAGYWVALKQGVCVERDTVQFRVQEAIRKRDDRSEITLMRVE